MTVHIFSNWRKYFCFILHDTAAEYYDLWAITVNQSNDTRTPHLNAVVCYLLGYFISFCGVFEKHLEIDIAFWRRELPPIRGHSFTIKGSDQVEASASMHPVAPHVHARP